MTPFWTENQPLEHLLLLLQYLILSLHCHRLREQLFISKKTFLNFRKVVRCWSIILWLDSLKQRGFFVCCWRCFEPPKSQSISHPLNPLVLLIVIFKYQTIVECILSQLTILDIFNKNIQSSNILPQLSYYPKKINTKLLFL